MRVLILALAVFVSACTVASEEDTGVSEMFKSYQASLLEDDGAAAVEFLSERTVNYYSEMVSKAVSMPEDGLRKESFLDRFTVLRLRDTFEPERLSTMTGEELLIYAIEQSWIDKEGTALYEVHKVTVRDDFAAIRMKRDGTEIPFPFEAYNENGTWKLDLTSVFEPANLGFVQQTQASGLTEDEFIHQILIALGSANGLTEQLWQPTDTRR